jgi:hypothetical protein
VGDQSGEEEFHFCRQSHIKCFLTLEVAERYAPQLLAYYNRLVAILATGGRLFDVSHEQMQLSPLRMIAKSRNNWIASYSSWEAK